MRSYPSHWNVGDWLVSAASEQGYGHIRNNTPNQDSHTIDTVKDFWGETWVLAVADGAGSAPLSDEGSRIAVNTAVQRLVNRIRKRPVLSGKDHMIRSELKGVVSRSRSEIKQRASKSGRDSRDFATTLLVAVVNEKTLATVQVGDGAIIVKDSSGDYSIVSEPQSGEYANETYFITSQKYPEAKINVIHDPDVAAIFMITDGLQPVAITNQNGEAYPGFFDPIIRTMWTDKNPAITAERIRDFISSERLRQKTIDDVTLVAAVRNRG